MDVAWNIYCGFRMSKFRYTALGRKNEEVNQAISVPRN